MTHDWSFAPVTVSSRNRYRKPNVFNNLPVLNNFILYYQHDK
ncbi:hypothetical protein ABIE58_002304 [Roseovarius sp. MBR-78]